MENIDVVVDKLFDRSQQLKKVWYAEQPFNLIIMHCSRGKIGKGGDGRLDRKYDKLDNKLDSLLA